MKKISLLLFASLFVVLNSLSQTNSTQIKRIDRLVKNIKSNIEFFEKVEVLNNELNSKTIYKDGLEIKLITVTALENINEDKVKKEVEWYFLNEKLIYAHQKWINQTSNKIIDEQQSYLNGEEMFSLIKNNTAIKEESNTFKETELGLVAYGKKLIEDNK
jgi:hypothetical protein